MLHSRFSNLCVDGSDLIFVPHNITFPAGSIDNTFSITIQDDVLLEMNETFNVTLLTFPSSRPIGIANGTTTVVIVDNDRKYLDYNTVYYEILTRENSGSGTVKNVDKLNHPYVR